METSLTNLMTALNLDPAESDHASLRDILRTSSLNLKSHTGVESALRYLTENRIPLVFCASDFRTGPWQEMLERISALPDPPYLIVTSRLADDRLWAEALNLGAWDVLSKPFDHGEVKRIVNSAWRHWNDRSNHRSPARAVA